MPSRGDLVRETRAIAREAKTNAVTVASVTGLLWIIEAINLSVFGGALAQYGIAPRTASGLLGILFAPFLHGGILHLLSNTLPLVFLGWLTMTRKRADFWVVSVVSALTAGLGTWLIGEAGTVHIGASGVIFGYLGFLLARGWYQRSLMAVSMSFFVAWVFGGMLWGLLPYLHAGISWEGHLFGFLGGLLCARALKKPNGR